MPNSNIETSHGLIARIRRFSAIAADDADRILDDPQDDSEPQVSLSDDLYVERRIEHELRKRIVRDREEDRMLMVLGEAGCGKTSLLWSLYRWLQDQHPQRETWLLKAGLLRLDAQARGEYPTAEELISAADSTLQIGRELAILIDTVDTRLHDPAERESLSALCSALLHLDCRLVVSCRPQEASRLPTQIRGKKPFHLENYDEHELTDAIRRHVRQFYARSGIQEGLENVDDVRRAAARGKPLREVCENPLTLRMLFALYAPNQIHDLEINICRLYARYWQAKVEDDLRSTEEHGESQAENLSRTAGAVALTMLAEGRPEIPVGILHGALEHFGGVTDQLNALVARGVLRRSRQKTIRFFHQTFFEHAAARGLLGFAGVAALQWANRRFLGALDDLFLAPVFEQAMVLAETGPPNVRLEASQILVNLLEERHPPMIRSALYVYAHRLDVEPRIKVGVRALLAETEESFSERQSIDPPTSIWLDFAPNTARNRLPAVLEELEIIWRQGGWNARRRAIDLLARLAVREPDGVRRAVRSWQLFDWYLEDIRDLQTDQHLLRIGTALLDKDPEWAWNFLLRIYDDVLRLRGYQASHALIAQEIARESKDPTTIASRFEDRFPKGEMPKIHTPIVEGHAELWRRQWQADGSDAAMVLERLRSEVDRLEDMPLYSRLSAWTDLLRSASPKVAEEALHWLALNTKRKVWSKGVRLVAAPLLRGPEPAARIFRKGLGRLLSDACRDGHAPQIRLSLDAVRAAQPTTEELREILVDCAESLELWLRADRLLPILHFGVASGAEGPRRALEQIVYCPTAYGNLDYLPKQLLRGNPDEDLADLACRLILSGENIKALLEILKAQNRAPNLFVRRADALADLVRSRSRPDDRSDRNPVIRRQAIDAWRDLIRLSILEPESFINIKTWFEKESDPRVKSAWIRLLTVSEDDEILADLVPFLAQIRDFHPVESLQDEARNQLAVVVGRAENPLPYLEEAIIAVTRPTVGAFRVGRLTNALSRLCEPETAPLVLKVIERIFDACQTTETSLTVTQDVGNKVTSVLIKAFRAVDYELRRPLIERCRSDEFEIARALLAAVFALPDPEPRQWIDQMLIDESVPERTRDLIRRHKYHSERPHGSDGYRELYRLPAVISTSASSQLPLLLEARRNREPAELKIRVRVDDQSGKLVLRYTLDGAGLNGVDVQGPSLISPETYAEQCRKRIDAWSGSQDLHGEKLTSVEQIESRVADFGRSLYLALFPEKMRRIYRKIRGRFDILQIVSDEPWIPWELVKPYDDAESPVIDDDFLGLRYQLARWLPGRAPAEEIRIRRFIALHADGGTGYAADEFRWVSEFARRYPNIESFNLNGATYEQFTRILKNKSPDFLHVIAHGRFDRHDPNHAHFITKDKRFFRSIDLNGPLATRIKETRPWVFLNVCHLGRQGQGLTGLGGWPQAFIQAGCGAFLGHQWPINGLTGFEFARILYQELEKEGVTIGQAVRTARKHLQSICKGPPAWASPTLYADPTARLLLGTRSTADHPKKLNDM